MASVAKPILNTLSMATTSSCIVSLPSLFSKNSTSFSIPSKSIKLSISSYSSSSLLASFVSLRRAKDSKFGTLFSAVAGEDNTVVLAEEETEAGLEGFEDEEGVSEEETEAGLEGFEDEEGVSEEETEAGLEGFEDEEGVSEEETDECIEDEEGVPEDETAGGFEGFQGVEAAVSEEPSEEAKLYVGNLPYDVESEQLAEIFLQAGVVETAEVIYNRETDTSRGFGFVTMQTVEEAEKAVEMFHRYDVGGRLLTVNKAAPRGSRAERPPRVFEPSSRIYVGNLSWDVDDSRLEQVFSEHGKVISARVITDRDSGRSRGFGFVAMANEAEMNEAIANLDGQNLDGRNIKVNVAEERPRRNF